MTEHLTECPVWRCCKPDERATMHMCICPDDEWVGELITRQRAEQIGQNIGQYGCVINASPLSMQWEKKHEFG